MMERTYLNISKSSPGNKRLTIAYLDNLVSRQIPDDEIKSTHKNFFPLKKEFLDIKNEDRSGNFLQ